MSKEIQLTSKKKAKKHLFFSMNKTSQFQEEKMYTNIYYYILLCCSII